HVRVPPTGVRGRPPGPGPAELRLQATGPEHPQDAGAGRHGGRRFHGGPPHAPDGQAARRVQGRFLRHGSHVRACAHPGGSGLMRIAVLAEPERFEIVDEAAPAAAPDEVLLRVTACGVCASELDMWKGLPGHATYPWHPGHEVTGTVEAVGDEVEAFAPGDAVT